jgi:8-oxo-dGTP pyrophosphatase MutT (NUDIX family)
MPSIANVREALAGHSPDTFDHEPQRRAAVALALREDAGPLEVLFIERASRDGDPWSGHMAFPGGRVDATDPGPREAAERETHEEVGLKLEGCELLGQLDDMQGLPGTARQLVVSAFVYHVTDPEPLNPNYEVRESFWFPVRSLLDPGIHIEHPMLRGSRTHFPGILVGEPGRHVVWGLTYRFLEGFLEIIGKPLPARWNVAAS